MLKPRMAFIDVQCTVYVQNIRARVTGQSSASRRTYSLSHILPANAYWAPLLYQATFSHRGHSSGQKDHPFAYSESLDSNGGSCSLTSEWSLSNAKYLVTSHVWVQGVRDKKTPPNHSPNLCFTFFLKLSCFPFTNTSLFFQQTNNTKILLG